jgi:hypothetical protein
MRFDGEVVQVAIGQNVVLRHGAETLEAMFGAVGRVLSLWERSVDVQMGLFGRLVGDLQPIALETYFHAPRSARESMLLLAMEENVARGGAAVLSPELRDRVKKALKRAEKLARTRNLIAHGQCTHVTMHENNQLAMKGFFLVPPSHKPNTTDRALEFAFDLADLQQFAEGVSGCLAAFHDAYISLVEAQQEAEKQIEPDVRLILQLARGATLQPQQVPLFLDSVVLSPAGQALAARWRALTTQ